MITNLLCTVTVCLVTNITEKFPQHMVSDPMPPGPNSETYAVFRCHYENDANPKRKDVITEIDEVTIYSFDFSPQTIRESKMISKSVAHFELNTTWEPSTNSLINNFP